MDISTIGQLASWFPGSDHPDRIGYLPPALKLPWMDQRRSVLDCNGKHFQERLCGRRRFLREFFQFELAAHFQLELSAANVD